jgi:hypothetical protein
VFYVGIGKKRRVKSKTNRNKYWHNIVNKVGYTIDIICVDLSWEEACVLEKQYIKKFGRKDLGLGNLVNMTDGGDGNVGWTDEKKLQLSIRMKNTKQTEVSKIKRAEAQKGQKNYFFGKKHTKETKNTISQKKKGCDGFWNGKNRDNNFKRNLSLSKTNLTIEDVINIKKLKTDNPKLSYNKISEMYNITRQTAAIFVKDNLWKNI